MLNATGQPTPHNKFGKLKHVCVHSEKSIILIEELPYVFWYQVSRLVISDKTWIYYPVKIFCVEQRTHEGQKTQQTRQ